MPHSPAMSAQLVNDLLDAFDAAEIPTWVAGGWGVDALVGRQTRVHRDLDLLYPIEHDDVIRSVLADLGFEPETDWWPVRVEFAGPSYVDIHPVRFAPDGSAVQAGLDGAEFHYPASAFGHGTIEGRAVQCLSADHQMLLHSGYEPRDVDKFDLAHLADLTGIS